MENMTKLYGSKGYIDMVPAPETTTREDDSRVDLILRIDEGKSYRISQILVLSADAGANKQLQLPQSAGDYLSRDPWWNFFKDNQSRFGPHTTFENALRCERNVRDGTLQVTLDFAACPQP
jgi:outer membrane protein assembly factor BamA